MIASLDVLGPATKQAARAWLDASVSTLAPDLRSGVREDLETALCEALDADASPADLDRVTASLGEIEQDASASGHDPRVGRFAGIPYDVRPPTTRRLLRHLWDPRNDKIFVPRTFGAGWDVNFGALAVRLGLIQPDAEDVPFESTPDVAFLTAALVPVALAGAVGAHYVVRGTSLPSSLPNHWNLDGVADRWISRKSAATLDLLGSGLMAATAVRAARSKRSARGSRATSIALSAGGSVLVAAVTVWRSEPDRRRPWAAPALGAAIIGATGGTFLGLAWAGRRAEQARDLGSAQ